MSVQMHDSLRLCSWGSGAVLIEIYQGLVLTGTILSRDNLDDGAFVEFQDLLVAASFIAKVDLVLTQIFDVAGGG